jgi:hypothetical protein
MTSKLEKQLNIAIKKMMMKGQAIA